MQIIISKFAMHIPGVGVKSTDGKILINLGATKTWEKAVSGSFTMPYKPCNAEMERPRNNSGK